MKKFQMIATCLLVTVLLASTPARGHALAPALVNIGYGVVGSLVANCIWDFSACKEKANKVVEAVKEHHRQEQAAFIKKHEAKGQECGTNGVIAWCNPARR